MVAPAVPAPADTEQGDWIVAGSAYLRVPRAVVQAAAWLLRGLRALAPSRVEVQEWVRYRVALSSQQHDSQAVLVPVTEAHIARLRTHPDRDANQLVSGFGHWNRGLRGALLWTEQGEPLCIQWLLTARDNGVLRTLPEWSGLYLPLAEGTGQVENLYTFSSARRKGVATDFEFALYGVARTMGLRTLYTHIAATNEPANAWARKTGWMVSGAITRWLVDVRGARRYPVCLHLGSDSAGARAGIAGR